MIGFVLMRETLPWSSTVVLSSWRNEKPRTAPRHRAGLLPRLGQKIVGPCRCCEVSRFQTANFATTKRDARTNNALKSREVCGKCRDCDADVQRAANRLGMSVASMRESPGPILRSKPACGEPTATAFLDHQRPSSESQWLNFILNFNHRATLGLSEEAGC